MLIQGITNEGIVNLLSTKYQDRMDSTAIRIMINYGTIILHEEKYYVGYPSVGVKLKR